MNKFFIISIIIFLVFILGAGVFLVWQKYSSLNEVGKTPDEVGKTPDEVGKTPDEVGKTSPETEALEIVAKEDFPKKIVNSEDSQKTDGPYYFIAIHNEPHHRPGGKLEVASDYKILKEIIAYADNYKVKLTLMFTAQWADYIVESQERLADLEAWKAAGHEIAGHHHSIYHTNWDGYTDFTSAEAVAQREEQGWIPEEYLGTLDDYIKVLQQINPDIKSGCLNDEHNKRMLPDVIIYDTCGGFAEHDILSNNVGRSAQGRNDHVLVGEFNGLKRYWISHTLIKTDNVLNSAIRTFEEMDSGVHGVVVHSFADQALKLYDFLDFLHQQDPTGANSRTVVEIMEQKILPEKEVPQEIIMATTPPREHTYREY